MFVHCSCVIVGIYILLILLYVFNSIVVVEKCNKVREREFLEEEEEEEEERVEKWKENGWFVIDENEEWVFLLSRAFFPSFPFIFHNFAWEIPILLYFLINNLMIVIRGVQRRQTICVCPDVYFYRHSSCVCQFTDSFIDFFLWTKINKAICKKWCY